ncbi:hypothetical protein HG536_0F01200 [Torulaspora globosa]|uniref:Nucleosome assembly protein n=1 Tax=Torulaspora globosa TaxID=48254 RepID=A0A7G3ZJV9_9SACH|nr:uncharacterized protein HG536_0F01200 [Torulaspora globosa]QLL33795.1 hypothetical protein HG536_0F01200 [Torulaspora globosa]
MSAPIRTKPKSSMKIDNAPTPHNTPASVLTGSFLKNGNPLKAEGAVDGGSGKGEAIPQTISEEDIQSALSNQPFLLQSIQDKLGSLVGQDSGYVSQLPEIVKDRLYGLKKIQNDLFALERDFQMEMFALEQKYLSKYSPLHERRYKIVSGREEPTAEEVKKGRELAMEEGEEEQAEDRAKNEEEQQDIKGIPSFWLTALENLPVVSETITDRDAEVLDYLVDIKLEYLSDGRPGFKLVFTFDEDTPFFKNKSLTKTYFYQKELGYSGDFIYDHAEGDEIQWTDNESNPTVSVEMRKQRNKATKQVRTIEKITPVDSFFNFFDPPKVPTREPTAQDADDADEQDEDELQELEERLALDYSIGEQLKDKLVPRAVDWFTGAALEFEFDNELADDEGFEDDDDDEAGEDDDEDEDEEEDEEEQDDFAKKEAAPECKQS